MQRCLVTEGMSRVWSDECPVPENGLLRISSFELWNSIMAFRDPGHFFETAAY